MTTRSAPSASAATVLPRGYVPAFLFRQLADSPEFAEFARILQRFGDPNLTLADAAKAACVSFTHFSRLFHKKAGITFTRYVQARRIQEAKHLMENPDTSISEICFGCGFNSLTHFYRIFLQSEGCSPSQFRAKEKGTGAGANEGERGKARR